MLRQRVTGDYLQTSAILDRQFDVVSAVNDINDYQGPVPAIASVPNAGRKLKILRAWFSPARSNKAVHLWNAQLNVRFSPYKRRRGG
jgi:hypothetical protein